jgi:hypothetical protein
MPAPLTFSATLGRLGINYCVDVPAAVSAALGEGPAIPVVGTVGDGVPLRSTLVPRGGGRHRLFLSGAVRAEAGIAEGDRVAVTLERDDAPRAAADELPEDLVTALREARATEAFAALPPGKRHEILQWIEAAAREATRAKRVARAVEEALRARESQMDRQR